MRLLVKRDEKPKYLTKEYVQKCRYCNSIYVYTLEDVSRDSGFLTSQNIIEYTKCPNCKTCNDVPLFKKKYKGE